MKPKPGIQSPLSRPLVMIRAAYNDNKIVGRQLEQRSQRKTLMLFLSPNNDNKTAGRLRKHCHTPMLIIFPLAQIK